MNLGKAALTLRLHSVVGGGEGSSLHVLTKSGTHERESFEDAQEAKEGKIQKDLTYRRIKTGGDEELSPSLAKTMLSPVSRFMVGVSREQRSWCDKFMAQCGAGPVLRKPGVHDSGAKFLSTDMAWLLAERERGRIVVVGGHRYEWIEGGHGMEETEASHWYCSSAISTDVDNLRWT